jgi:hypothetical protein
LGRNGTTPGFEAIASVTSSKDAIVFFTPIAWEAISEQDMVTAISASSIFGEGAISSHCLDLGFRSRSLQLCSSVSTTIGSSKCWLHGFLEI